jgi:exosortase
MSSPPGPAASVNPVALIWAGAALVFGWLLVIRAGWWEWSLNPQYSYGMLVPVLSLMLLARRWPDRPERTAPSPRGRTLAVILLAMGVLVLALLQPLLLSNADWRAVPATAAVAGVTMTLCLVYFAGGRPWLAHFAFPVCFFLVAVPWPKPFENAVMSWLMLRNSALCVEALQWMGYAAEQRGNLIAIPGSLLGVEEACSGIRSLQSMIMVALAVGEFFRLTAGRRLGLFLLGLGAALAGNALRSLTLSVAACRSGADAVDTIHDGTGLAVLAVASVIVLIAGKLMATKSPGTEMEMSLPQAGDLLPRHANLRVIRAAALAAVALWAGLWIAAEGWFRYNESQAPPAITMWELQRAPADGSTREVPLAERTLDILLFPDTAFSDQWRDEEGWQWQAFYFRWKPGKTSVQSAFVVHDPRTCLGAAGFELDRKLPAWTAEIGSFRIPFQRYIFLDRGRPVHVFHAVVEDDGNPIVTGDEFGRDARWDNILSGRRNRGLRVLEFAVRGPIDPAEAEAAAASWLNRRIGAEGA